VGTNRQDNGGLDLHAVHRAVQTLDERGILRLASEAGSADVGGWFARARAIGELQRRADYKDAAVVRHAKDLGIGKTLAFELGAIDKRILLPRLKDQGDAAKFPILEKRYYVTAIRCAPAARRSPLAILAIAEAELAKGHRISTRTLREMVGVASDTDPLLAIEKCLEKLSQLGDPARQRYVHAVKEPDEALRMTESAIKSARMLATALREKLQENA